MKFVVSNGAEAALLSLLDITRQKQADTEMEQLVEERTRDLAAQAEALSKANERLQHLDEMKSAIMTSVSHELRTPLTSILGFAKLVKKDFVSYFGPLSGSAGVLSRKKERIEANLNVIEGEGVRLGRLVKDFFDMAEIEFGSATWDDQAVNAKGCTERAIRKMAEVFADKVGVRLAIEMSDPLPALTADPERVEQVLVNLLHNAVKFTHEGVVTLHVGTSDHGGLRFEVHDTGIGIPEEHIERVFEKFHQVELSDTLVDSSKGAGLGLTLCREIVEHYGGTIQAQSSPGKGSTFIVEFPPEV